MSRHINTTAEEDEQDECMPDITLEPPTPFEAGASMRFYQGTSHSANTLSAYHQSPLRDSPRRTSSDQTFAWQDSPSHSHDSHSMSRPSSTSGWSMSGTSVSGDDSLFAASDNSNSNSPSATAAKTPSQAGKSKSHARKKAPGHVSRPRNAFILFRSHAITNKIIPPSLGVKDNRAVSCIVATLWKSLPEDERKQWKSEAEKEKELHKQQYPDYQFKPGNCGTKGKMRSHAKTEETVKEQCEIIADQILRAHGRSPTRQEGEAKKKREVAAAKRAVRNKDGLPRARKNVPLRNRQMNDEAVPETEEVQVEVKEEEEEYIAPIVLPGSRRRSSSLPGSQIPFKRHETGADMFSSWQARIEQHEQPLALVQEAPLDSITFNQPWQQSLAGRRCVNPAALKFTVPTSFGDMVSFASPRTITAGMSISAPSPRYSLFGVTDRPTISSPTYPSRRLDDVQTEGTDAMLLSPIKSSFYDSRSNSGWQSWSRYSYADIALPVMKPRQSIDGTFTRRESRPSQGLFQDINDGISSQADNTNSAHISLHQNFFSPTLQTFHQRYNTDYKSHHHQQPDEDMLDTSSHLPLPNPRIKSTSSSTLDDADATPSLSRLAL